MTTLTLFIIGDVNIEGFNSRYCGGIYVLSYFVSFEFGATMSVTRW